MFRFELACSALVPLAAGTPPVSVLEWCCLGRGYFVYRCKDAGGHKAVMTAPNGKVAMDFPIGADMPMEEISRMAEKFLPQGGKAAKSAPEDFQA